MHSSLGLSLGRCQMLEHERRAPMILNCFKRHGLWESLSAQTPCAVRIHTRSRLDAVLLQDVMPNESSGPAIIPAQDPLLWHNGEALEEPETEVHLYCCLTRHGDHWQGYHYEYMTPQLPAPEMSDGSGPGHVPGTSGTKRCAGEPCSSKACEESAPRKRRGDSSDEVADDCASSAAFTELARWAVRGVHVQCATREGEETTRGEPNGSASISWADAPELCSDIPSREIQARCGSIGKGAQAAAHNASAARTCPVV